MSKLEQEQKIRAKLAQIILKRDEYTFTSKTKHKRANKAILKLNEKEFYNYEFHTRKNQFLYWWTKQWTLFWWLQKRIKTQITLLN